MQLGFNYFTDAGEMGRFFLTNACRGGIIIKARCGAVGGARRLGACSRFRLRFPDKRAIGRKTAETRGKRDRAAEKIAA